MDKNIRKISTLNVYNFGKRCKIAHFEKVPRAKHVGGHRNSQRSQFASSLARWEVVRQRHGPIARGPGGVASSLPCGTVSNAFVLLSPV